MRIPVLVSVWAMLIAALTGPGFARDPASTPLPPAESTVPIALLVDANSGQVLHERNAELRFMPASIAKVMTAYTAFELIGQGKLDPRRAFPIRPETFRQWQRRGSTMFIPKDARVPVDQLLMGIMNVSANDGAVVLAEGAAGSVKGWTALMNDNARKLGMSNSHFATPNGWMDEGKTFVSAHDLAKLASAMIMDHPRLYARYVGRTEFTYNGITQFNHDPLIGRVAGADGIKTGYTDQAGYGYLGSARRGNEQLILVVAGADSQIVRDRAARDYVEWGFSQFDHHRLFAKGAIVGSALVQDGNLRSVDLMTAVPIHVALPKGTTPQVTVQIRYDGPLKAPVIAGDEIAKLEVMIEGMPPAYFSIVAAENAQKAGFFGRIWNGIAGWLA